MNAPLRNGGLALSLTTERCDVCQARALVGTKRVPDPEKIKDQTRTVLSGADWMWAFIAASRSLAETDVEQ